jgi:hypothetical protein
MIKLKRLTLLTNQLLLKPRASDTVTKTTATLKKLAVKKEKRSKIERHISRGKKIKVSAKQASNC